MVMKEGVRMEGVIFLFSTWGMWIVSTFIVERKVPYRVHLAALALLLIILFDLNVQIFSMTISAPACLLLLIGYVYTSMLSAGKKFYMIFSVLIIMMGYAGFLMLEMYDPIWLIVDRRIILLFFIFVVAYFLFPHSFLSRLVFVLLGMVQGEILFSFILASWHIPYLVGGGGALDLIAAILLFLGLTHMIGKAFSGWTKLNGQMKTVKKI